MATVEEKPGKGAFSTEPLNTRTGETMVLIILRHAGEERNARTIQHLTTGCSLAAEKCILLTMIRWASNYRRTM